MKLSPSEQNFGRLTTAINDAIEQRLKNVHTGMPGIVVGYDAPTKRAFVSLALKLLLTDGTTRERALLADVPVIWPSGSGVTLTAPLHKNDAVWVAFSERGINEFKKDFKFAKPDATRFFSEGDAVCIPGFGATKITPVGTDGMTIQSEDGDVFLTVGERAIKAKAWEVDISGDVTITGDLVANTPPPTADDGHVATTEWVKSNIGGTGGVGPRGLPGADGKDGQDGKDGAPGQPGPAGKDGSAAPDATETIKGLIEIASEDEGKDGTDKVRAMTPKLVADRIAAVTALIPTVATVGQALRGTNRVRYIASDVLKSVLDMRLALKANLMSPVFMGKPETPAPATASNDDQIASTKWVRTHVAGATPNAEQVQDIIGGIVNDYLIYDDAGNEINVDYDGIRKQLLVDGVSGPTGKQGPAGKDGQDGDDGQDGADGLPGKDGADGTPGKDGLPGKDGADGKTGPAGPAGTPGAAGIRWLGAWDVATAYVVRDGVSHKGSSYIATTSNTGSEPSATSTDWDTLAEIGGDGIQGEKGDKALRWRGAWSASATYEVDDVVHSDGDAWISVFRHRNEKPSDAAEPADWAVLESKVWRIESGRPAGSRRMIISYANVAPWANPGLVMPKSTRVTINGRTYITDRDINSHNASDRVYFFTDATSGAVGTDFTFNNPVSVAMPRFWGLFVERGAQGVPGPAGPASTKGDKGDTGPRGPAGPMGSKGMNWRGPWVAHRSYDLDDVVSNGGSSWIAIRPHTSNNTLRPPSATEWTLVVKTGDAGADGAAGTPGLPGKDGAKGDKGDPGADGKTGPIGPVGPTGADGPGPTWRGTYVLNRRYEVDDLVFYQGSTYRTYQAHTSSSSTPAPGGDARYWSDVAKKGDLGPGFTWRRTWASSTTYRVDDVVEYRGSAYICRKDHTSANTSIPTLLVEWDVMSARGIQGPTGPTGPTGPGFVYRGTWTIGTTYKTNDTVVLDGSWYIALTDHLAANVSKPGRSTTHWDVVSAGGTKGNDGTDGVDGRSFVFVGAWGEPKNYAIDEVVTDGGASFICTAGHVSAPANRPNSAADTTQWARLALRGMDGQDGQDGTDGTGFRHRGLWGTGVTYQVNDLASDDGSWFICIEYHISTTTNRPSPTDLSQRRWQWVTLRGLRGYTGTAGTPGKDGVDGAKGDRGYPGVKGDTGDPGLRWRGQWLNSATYVVKDTVYSLGNVWICTKDNPTVAPPIRSDLTSSHWDLFAVSGKDGTDGQDGATGPAGKGLTWWGTWTSSRRYVASDIVHYLGDAWIATADSTNQTPATPSTYWNLLVRAGTNGKDGKPGIVWRGDWATATKYVPGDAVYYNGASWVCTFNNQGSYPRIGGGWWDELTARGTAGADGKDGTPGKAGPQGLKGDDGDDGTPGLVWRGTWDRILDYVVSDAVEYQGASYICVTNNKDSTPSASSTYWDVLAEAGADGNDGAAGTPGQPGRDGQKGDKGDPGSDGKDGTKGDKGDAGTDGTDGKDGKPGVNWLGNWLNSINYVVGDGVEYAGSSYIATFANRNQVPPSYTGSWDLLAAKGAGGTDGGDAPDATTTTKGLVELATQSEVNLGTDVVRAVTPGTLGVYAKLASPILTGDPQAPTPTTGDDDTSIATTEFVNNTLAALPTAKTVDPNQRFTARDFDFAHAPNPVVYLAQATYGSRINATDLVTKTDVRWRRFSLRPTLQKVASETISGEHFDGFAVRGEHFYVLSTYSAGGETRYNVTKRKVTRALTNDGNIDGVGNATLLAANDTRLFVGLIDTKGSFIRVYDIATMQLLGEVRHTRPSDLDSGDIVKFAGAFTYQDQAIFIDSSKYGTLGYAYVDPAMSRSMPLVPAADDQKITFEAYTGVGDKTDYSVAFSDGRYVWLIDNDDKDYARAFDLQSRSAWVSRTAQNILRAPSQDINLGKGDWRGAGAYQPVVTHLGPATADDTHAWVAHTEENGDTYARKYTLAGGTRNSSDDIKLTSYQVGGIWVDDAHIYYIYKNTDSTPNVWEHRCRSLTTGATVGKYEFDILRDDYEYTGAAADASGVWLLDNTYNTLLRYNFTTITTTQNDPPSDAWGINPLPGNSDDEYRGCAWDGEYLWAQNITGGYVKGYDPTTSQVNVPKNRPIIFDLEHDNTVGMFADRRAAGTNSIYVFTDQTAYAHESYANSVIVGPTYFASVGETVHGLTPDDHTEAVSLRGARKAFPRAEYMSIGYKGTDQDLGVARWIRNDENDMTLEFDRSKMGVQPDYVDDKIASMTFASASGGMYTITRDSSKDVSVGQSTEGIVAYQGRLYAAQSGSGQDFAYTLDSNGVPVSSPGNDLYLPDVVTTDKTYRKGIRDNVHMGLLRWNTYGTAEEGNPRFSRVVNPERYVTFPWYSIRPLDIGLMPKGWDADDSRTSMTSIGSTMWWFSPGAGYVARAATVTRTSEVKQDGQVKMATDFEVMSADFRSATDDGIWTDKAVSLNSAVRHFLRAETILIRNQDAPPDHRVGTLERWFDADTGRITLVAYREL